MKAKSTTEEEQLNHILECRRSGLTVYQWCEKKGITPTSYYNWISRLRKKGITLPEFTASNPVPILNEVVQVTIAQERDEINYAQNRNIPFLENAPASPSQPVVEILLGDATVRFFNHTDPVIIESTLRSLGGIYHVR